MAADLRLHRCWFHAGRFPHYDIPKLRRREVEARCGRVTSKRIVEIIKEHGLG